MRSIAPARADVTVGVDTHKRSHVAVALDGRGQRLDTLSIAASGAGYEQLLSWARAQGRVTAFGVEGTASYGSGLTRFLQHRGHAVVEVMRPNRAERRRNGKDDALDAERAARAVLSGEATGLPKGSDGRVESIRVLKVARDSAVKARTQAMVTLKALLVTAHEELRRELEPLTARRLVQECAVLDVSADDSPGTAMRHALRSLAGRWLTLDEEIKQHTRLLDAATEAAAPALRALYGVGTEVAADLLIAAGDRAGRIRNEAAFAKLCGVAPLPASSGAVTRHRLSRGGNRRANAALHRLVLVRMRHHEPTQAYVRRRVAEGKTKREIIRCLKRYAAREVLRSIVHPAVSITA
jgi:transposase